MIEQQNHAPDCLLCNSAGGELVHGNAKFRVIEAGDANYPGFLRLIWNAHVREFSMLSREDRLLCADVLAQLECFILSEFKADKVNLASLGNQVPHLHWHVIPRFTDDAHFPAPVWAALPHPEIPLSTRQQLVLSNKSVWMLKLKKELELFCVNKLA